MPFCVGEVYGSDAPVQVPLSTNTCWPGGLVGQVAYHQPSALARVRRSLSADAGIAFCFAPVFHPNGRKLDYKVVRLVGPKLLTGKGPGGGVLTPQ